VKRYSKYKDSGVPWLGHVPEHWEVKRLKRVFMEVNQKANPGDEQLAATQKYGVISQSQFMKAEDQKLVLAIKGTENFKHVEKNDFVISLRAFEGGIERSNQAGCVSPAYTVLRSRGSLSPKFSSRLLKTPAFISQISMTYDGIREGKAIKFKDAGPVYLPIPPDTEQEIISDFIDDTLNKMDTTISTQERMIELLKERRSAIITQAVTKGLNPNAKMKDSGIDWLGSVPTHWELGRLGSYVSLRGEKGSDKEYEPLSVTKNGIVPQLETAAKSDDGENRKIVRKGDIAINGRSDRKGSSGLAEIDGSVSLINIVLKIERGLYPRFAHHLIRSVAFQEEFYRWGRGIVADLWSTNYWDLKRIPSALPTIEEQKLISNFLDKTLQDMDSAIESQERMIELLKERRSAIITQAVNGQIDVR